MYSTVVNDSPSTLIVSVHVSVDALTNDVATANGIRVARCVKVS